MQVVRKPISPEMDSKDEQMIGVMCAALIIAVIQILCAVMAYDPRLYAVKAHAETYGVSPSSRVLGLDLSSRAIKLTSVKTAV